MPVQFCIRLINILLQLITVSNLGNHLRIKLSPESSNEQQLTDDGFEELARYQEHWPSLRELDIQVKVRIIQSIKLKGTFEMDRAENRLIRKVVIKESRKNVFRKIRLSLLL
jgi:hypothetical protein